MLFEQYNTTETIGSFLFIIIFGSIVGTIFLGVGLLVPILLVNLGWPGFYNTFKKDRPL